VRDVALFGPAAVGVWREGNVKNPRRTSVSAYPDLTVGANIGEPVVERAEPALVDVPRCPTVAEEASKVLSVARPDEDVHVLVVARNARKGLNAPAPDDPPWAIEPVHEGCDGAWVQGFPAPVPAVELYKREMADLGRLRCGRLAGVRRHGPAAYCGTV
jgi:hypothetical protein